MKTALIKRTYKKGTYALIGGEETTYYNARGEQLDEQEFQKIQETAKRMIDRIEISAEEVKALVDRANCETFKCKTKNGTKVLIPISYDDVALVEIQILGEVPYYTLSHSSHIEDSLTIFKRFYWRSDEDYREHFLTFYGLSENMLECGEVFGQQSTWKLDFILDGNDCTIYYNQDDLYKVKLNSKIQSEQAKNQIMNDALEAVGL
jgi:hypothetical protein